MAAANSGLDVLLKNAVIVYAAYQGGLGPRALSLVATLSWALFMAPFFLFSAHGGHLGDHVNNRRLALGLKGADVAIAAAAAYGFRTGDIALLLGAVFAKGVTATLFSPIKYALVFDLLPSKARQTGYALVEAASMVAILGGAYFGAMFGADPHPWKIGLVALTLAGVSLLAALFYPDLPRPGDGGASPGLDPVRPTMRILRMAFSNPRGACAILALAWFWALGAVYMSNIAVLVRETFHGDSAQVATILVTFTLGVSLGLAGSGWFARGRWSGRTGIVMAVVIAATGVGLPLSGPHASGLTLLLFFVLAFATGVYSGHYSSMLYRAASEEDRSRLFAANNITSSLVMVLALALNALLFRLQVEVETGLALFAAASIPVTLWVGAIGGAPEKA